jgi:hypothetical protein
MSKPPPTRPNDGVMNTKTINAELFAMTYGSFVRFTVEQARAGCPDASWAQGVNETLRAMGHRMGERLVDDFFIRDAEMSNRSQQLGPQGICSTLRAVVEALARRALPMFLGMGENDIRVEEAPTDPSRDAPGTSAYDLVFVRETPLTTFVELPKQLREAGIWYSNVICGAIEGAVRMLEYPVGGVRANFVSDRLVTPGGDTRIRIQYTKPADEMKR